MSNYIIACFVLQPFSSSLMLLFSATQSELMRAFKATNKVNIEDDTILLQDNVSSSRMKFSIC